MNNVIIYGMILSGPAINDFVGHCTLLPKPLPLRDDEVVAGGCATVRKDNSVRPWLEEMPRTVFDNLAGIDFQFDFTGGHQTST